MGNSSYAEKLKDPRWQKKRLEILERDKWTCKFCGDAEETLHVHHLFYMPKIEPWDIPDGFLLTLCESCHLNTNKEEHAPSDVILESLNIFLKELWGNGYDSDHLKSIGCQFQDFRIPDGCWADIVIKSYFLNKNEA